MLNRRLIRVKVFQALFAYNQDDTPSLNRANAYLTDSVEGIYQNFRTVFLFPLELIHYIRTVQNPQDNRYIKDAINDKAYNHMSLNGLYEFLVQQDDIRQAMERPAHSWQSDKELLHTLYRQLRESDTTEKYLKKDQPSFKDQAKFLRRIVDFINNNENFNQAMEEVEMLWEDEKVPVFNFVRKIVNEIEEGKEVKLPRANDSGDDSKSFALELLSKTIASQKEFNELISQNSPGWDKDRIARADMIIMCLALTELIHFPYIPVKVTLNEYLELAKNYSTPQSSKFINGVLDKLVKQLKAENRLVKKGRGMIES